MKRIKRLAACLLSVLLLAAVMVQPVSANMLEALQQPKQLRSSGDVTSIRIPEDGREGYVYRESIDIASERSSAAPAFNLNNAAMEGSFYSQLNANAKKFYNVLTDMTVSKIVSVQPNDGYNSIEFSISGISSTNLTGYVSGSTFYYDNASSQKETQLYTDMLAAITAFRYDRADSFWTSTMKYGYNYQFINNSTIRITNFVFSFFLYYGGQEKMMWENMTARADAIANEAKKQPDTYSKVKFVHDYLAETNEYSSVIEKYAYYPQHQAYSALIPEWGYDPVCDGYSKAMKLVLDRLDVPCVLVISDEHMWNNVKMDDGLWYNFDLTWNDTGYDPYAYFLIGNETLIDGVMFKSEKDHLELNIYEQPTGLYNVVFSYPVKNKTAYKYIGKDYDPPKFPDVKRSDWFFDEVETANELGIFNGDNTGKFNPVKNITRAEFAQALANHFGADLNAFRYSSYSDVDTGKWYAAPTSWAAKEGYMNGSAGRFRPNDPISREEMCVVFYNIEHKGGAVKITEKFPDDSKISMWAKDAVYFCKEAGLVAGSNTGEFNPRGKTTRAQAATVFVRYALSK